MPNKSRQLTLFTFNLQAKPSLIRHDEMEGKEYLVVPCVMLIEGVHTGSQGDIYYPPEELAKTPEVWNGRPVVVYHPEMNGKNVSAGHPQIFTDQKVGTVMNARWEDGKLKADVWLDEERAREVDERVMDALDAGTVMEVSTGLFTDNEDTSGEWNGQPYEAIARNFRPDHLALLPDRVGACSVADGAGLLRNQLASGVCIPPSLVEIYNAMSHSEVHQELQRLLRPDGSGISSAISTVWIIEVFDDFFIYEDGDKLYHREYETKDDVITLMGMPQEAVRDVRYKLANGSIVGNVSLTENHKEDTVNKEKIVKALISNAANPFTEDDTEMLMGLSEDRLSWMTTNQGKPKDESTQETPDDVPADKAKEDASAADTTDAGEAAPVDNTLTAQQYIENAPPGVRDMLFNGLTNHLAERAKLIASIIANERNTFTEEYLQKMGMQEIQAIAHLAAVPEAAPTAQPPTFAGQGPVIPVSNESAKEEAMVAPTLNFDNDQKE